MKTRKKALSFGSALILAVSMGSVYAEESEIIPTATQDRIRTEANLQTPDSELTQARIREQKMESTYVKEGDMTQTRTQARIRTEANLQTSESRQDQASIREQKRERDANQSKTKVRNEFRNNFKARQSGASSSFMAGQNRVNRPVRKVR